jgi:hypothetical protein
MAHVRTHEFALKLLPIFVLGSAREHLLRRAAGSPTKTGAGKKSEACGESGHGITQAAIGQGTRGRSQPSHGHPSCQQKNVHPAPVRMTNVVLQTAINCGVNGHYVREGPSEGFR